MQPSRRLRRAVAAVLVAVALPVLSGCAAGFDSPVMRDYNPVVGVNVRDGEVWAMNMLVVLPESGRGTLVGSLLNKGRADDRLVGASVSVPAKGEATVQSSDGATTQETIQSSMQRSSVPLAPEQLVELSDPTTVAVEGDVTPGRFVDLTLQFQNAEPIQVKVPVVDAEGPYAEVPLP